MYIDIVHLDNPNSITSIPIQLLFEINDRNDIRLPDASFFQAESKSNLMGQKLMRSKCLYRLLVEEKSK